MTAPFERERRLRFTPNHQGIREEDRILGAIAEKVAHAMGEDESGELFNEARQIVATTWRNADRIVVTVHGETTATVLSYYGPKGDQREPKIDAVVEDVSGDQQVAVFKPTVKRKEYLTRLTSIGLIIGAPGIGAPPRNARK